MSASPPLFHLTPRTLQDVSTLAQGSGRNVAHQALVHDLYWTLRRANHIVAAGCVTITGKRPDLVSIRPDGELVIWEAKTRFEQYERRQAWEKYRSHCQRLYMAYPMGTDLFNWSPVSFLPAQPSSRFLGALLVSKTEYHLERCAQALTSEPTGLLHLTQSCLRLSGSTAKKFSAAESS